MGDHHMARATSAAASAQCETCGGAEKSLTTDCPGRRLSVSEVRQVQMNGLDYIAGVGWTFHAHDKPVPSTIVKEMVRETGMRYARAI